MNKTLLEQLKAGIESCGMRGAGVVAVSGGPDSVALLLSLSRLQNECSLTLSAAHLNHSLRGEESDRDARFVERLAQSLNVPCDVEQVDVASLTASGTGVEETARNARLEFLKRTAERRQASWVATAHLAGLRGIPLHRELAPGISLVRPLLKIPRESLLSALAEWNQDYCRDSSNTSEEFTRNRIRHRLLPLLRAEFNPRVAEALERLAAQAGEWETFLRTTAKEFLNTSLLEQTSQGYRLRRSPWLDRSPLLQQEALCQLWAEQDWPRRNMSAAHWERAIETIRRAGKQDFPGQVRLDVRDDLIRLYRE
jgi:tRNA(Ile)-lysidine synthase